MERLPDGPILFHVDAAGEAATIAPVGEIAGDSLRPIRAVSDPRVFGENFIAEHLRQGSEFVLFHEGVRAGTLIVREAALEGSACGLVPRGRGTLELGTPGSGVTEFLALARVRAPEVPRLAAGALEPTRTMRVLAPIYADQMLRRRGAQLPGDWNRAMAQLRVIGLGEGRNPGFASTFLVGDTLGPGLDDAGHSLFFLALPDRLGFDTVFVSFRAYGETRKAAPRLVDFLDWNGDAWPEMLLRIYGTGDTWFEAIGRNAAGDWRAMFSHRCEPEPAAPDSVAVDTATAGGAAVRPDSAGTR